VKVAFDDNSVHVYNAFTIKDDLKVRGYRWNPGDKSWFISPEDVQREMEVLQNNLKSQAPKVKQSTAPVPAHLPDSLSVSDLRNRLDRLIRDGIQGNVWVRGVIASAVKSYKWASYLDLKDEDQTKDIFFRVEVKAADLEKINRKLAEIGVATELEQDLPVFCNVNVHLPLRNVVDIRLSLLDILPEYTQSRIRNQREATLEQLGREGILKNQQQLVLPTLVANVGLITSQQGTSVKDINAGLHPYAGKYCFYFVDSRMEGANAVDGIISALDFLEFKSGIALDAIVIARGGGSEQSLAVFNDLALCRRVCTAGIPILTAIGHEKDVSAIELCSCFTPTPSTPSGIGKFLQNRYLWLQEQLSAAVTRLIHYFTNAQQREMEKIKSYLKNIPDRAAAVLKIKEQRFFAVTNNLEQSTSFLVRDHQRRVVRLSDEILRGGVDLSRRHVKNVELLTRSLTARVEMFRQRKFKEVVHIIKKLDFEKRRRSNRSMLDHLIKQAGDVRLQSQKKLKNAEKDLLTRIQLVEARDPHKILEKGFTLTLDKNNRVVKSLEQFNGLGGAVLKFHDGETPIMPVVPVVPIVPAVPAEQASDVKTNKTVDKKIDEIG